MEEFKIGDKVICIKDCTTYNNKNTKAKKGDVLNVDFKGSKIKYSKYQCFWSSSTHSGAFLQEDFMLLSEYERLNAVTKFIDDNTVQTKNGNIFKIGDIVVNVQSQGTKESFIIQKFNNTKNGIKAHFKDKTQQRNVKVENLELIIEKEETLLEKAQRLYLNKKFKKFFKPPYGNYGIGSAARQSSDIYEGTFGIQNEYCIYSNGNGIYLNGQWAEIIED